MHVNNVNTICKYMDKPYVYLHYYRLVIHSQLTRKLRFPTYIINALITQYNCFINNTSLFIQLTVSVSQSSIKPPCHQRCSTEQFLWSCLWSIIHLWSDSWCGIRYGSDLAMVFVFKNNNCAALNTLHRVRLFAENPAMARLRNVLRGQLK